VKDSVESIDSNRDDGCLQLSSDHADSWLKLANFTGVGPTTFWENQYRVTVVKKLAEVSNGLAGASFSLR
jgi:hypothetical protein